MLQNDWQTSQIALYDALESLFAVAPCRGICKLVLNLIENHVLAGCKACSGLKWFGLSDLGQNFHSLTQFSRRLSGGCQLTGCGDLIM